MGQGEEENTRGMGVFDLGELSLKGGMSIYIKCQRFFFFLTPFVTQRKSLFCFNYSCSFLISRAGANVVVCVPPRASWMNFPKESDPHNRHGYWIIVAFKRPHDPLGATPCHLLSAGLAGCWEVQVVHGCKSGGRASDCMRLWGLLSQLLYSKSRTSQHNRFSEICKWHLREIWFLRSLSFCVFCIRFSSQEICIRDCSLTFLAGCWPPVLLLKYETGVWTKSGRFGPGSAQIQIYFNEICFIYTINDVTQISFHIWM